MDRRFLAWGFFFGLTAVILGAFASHALKASLSAEQLSSFQTGIRYQMYHSILLLILGFQTKLIFQKGTILYLLVIGIVCFSISIYILSLKNILGIEGLSIVGPVTPIGGSLLIISWALLLIKVLKKGNLKGE